MKDANKMSFAERYSILPEEYEDINITSLPLSPRTMSRFIAHNIKTLSDLLKTTTDMLMHFSGFGAKCLSEVETYISNMTSIEHKQAGGIQNDIRVRKLAYNHRDAIARGEFPDIDELDFTQSEKESLDIYKNAYKLLGKELVFACFNDLDKVRSIISAIDNFSSKMERYIQALKLICDLSLTRRENHVIYYINAFTTDEGNRIKLLSFFKDSPGTFSSIFNTEYFANDKYYFLLVKFLKWCNFDLQSETQKFFKSLYSTDRIKMIIHMRAQKNTLQQIAELIGITRERVRQIEKKARQKFARWQSSAKVVARVSAERNGDRVLTPYEIEDYFGTNIDELLFFLRSYDSNVYFYDSQADVFIVGDDDLSSRAQDYIEKLPDIIKKEEIKRILNEAEIGEDIPSELFEKVFQETYKFSGNVYHRCRLSRSAIYTDILEKYYPNGFKAYDPMEIQAFRERVYEVYGDVHLPDNDRALSARISSICVLCDKGSYISKKDKYISDDLAKKIYEYINHSENQIFLTNTIFCVFEDELRMNGVNNRYYLQGILRELYGDKFVFRRDYISKDKNITSIYSEIVKFIKKSDYPVSKLQVQNAFPGITDIVINFATSDSEILNYFGEYLHASKLEISESEKNYLDGVLERFLSDGKAHHIREIYDHIMHESAEVLTKNAAMLPFHTFSILEYMYRNEYQFFRPYIALIGVEIGRPAERLHDMIYSRDEIDIADITEFARDNRFQIPSLLDYINSCNDVFLMVDNTKIMTIKKIGLTHEIAMEAEKLILREVDRTKPINMLTCYSYLPNINVQWTDWLIYSMLNKWSQRLSVDVSVAKIKHAVPLVALYNKMNLSNFEGMKQENYVATSADNLDNIDELLLDIIDDDIFKEDI